MSFFLGLLPLAQSQPAGTRELVDGLARTPLSQVVLFVVLLSVLRVAILPVLKNTHSRRRLAAYGSLRFLNEMLDACVYAGVFVFMLIRPFAVQAFLVPSGSMWPTLQVDDFIVANKAVYRYTDPKPNDIVVFRPPVAAATKRDDLDADGNMKVDYVKRCVGTPGDLVEIKRGILYRNGVAANEPYKTYSECTKQPPNEECQEFRTLSGDEVKNLTLASFKLVDFNGAVIPLDYTDLDANAALPRNENPMDDHPPYQVASRYQLTTPHDQNMLKAHPAVRVPPGYFLMMGDNRNASWDGRVWGLVKRDQIIGRAEFVWWPLTAIHRLK